MAVGPQVEVFMSSPKAGQAAACGRTLAVSALLLVIAIAIFGLRIPVEAQSTTGRILGTITDPSGAAVAGANVTITDESGAYAAPNLEPGTYRVRAEGKGFKTLERPNVQLEVATDVRLDFALQPGQVNET